MSTDAERLRILREHGRGEHRMAQRDCPACVRFTRGTSEPDLCRSCGAEVIWRRSEGFHRWAPLDAKPNPQGNAILLPGGLYRVIGPPNLIDREPRTPRYMPHHATCPHAHLWRGSRRRRDSVRAEPDEGGPAS